MIMKQVWDFWSEIANNPFTIPPPAAWTTEPKEVALMNSCSWLQVVTQPSAASAELKFHQTRLFFPVSSCPVLVSLCHCSLRFLLLSDWSETWCGFLLLLLSNPEFLLRSFKLVLKMYLEFPIDSTHIGKLCFSKFLTITNTGCSVSVTG